MTPFEIDGLSVGRACDPHVWASWQESSLLLNMGTLRGHNGTLVLMNLRGAEEVFTGMPGRMSGGDHSAPCRIGLDTRLCTRICASFQPSFSGPSSSSLVIPNLRTTHTQCISAVNTEGEEIIPESPWRVPCHGEGFGFPFHCPSRSWVTAEC